MKGDSGIGHLTKSKATFSFEALSLLRIYLEVGFFRGVSCYLGKESVQKIAKKGFFF